jgi:hypothetical protein
MFHVFDFLKYIVPEGVIGMVLIAVFLVMFIIEKNPKPQEEKSEEEYEEEEYSEEKEEYSEEKYENEREEK